MLLPLDFPIAGKSFIGAHELIMNLYEWIVI